LNEWWAQRRGSSHQADDTCSHANVLPSSYVSLNANMRLFPLCSGVGKEEKHTREGYKTGQKRQAFKRLEEVGDNLNVHMQVVQRAKEE
jgi:hypothetical protein